MKARGSIGDSWWSRRFIEPLEASTDKGRISRGRTYARRGAVQTLGIVAGRVTAKVSGSRPQPYTVTIGFTAIDDALWHEISAVLANEALFRAALLSGELPPEIEDVFDDFEAPLFPESLADLDIICNCPDRSHPCKHAVAALYTLADAFDRDPFLLPAWLGRDRESLLEEIRGHAEGGADEQSSGSGLHVRARPLPECVDDFWAAGEPVRLTPPARTLDPISHADLDVPGLVTALVPMYDRMVQQAPAPHAAARAAPSTPGR